MFTSAYRNCCPIVVTLINMKKTLAFAAGMFAASLLAQNIQPPHTSLKEGDMAPDFTLPSTRGEKVTLSSFRGKNTVVLAFFPAAFTGG
jgi:cytochrome oxidase Cu insertion factor (SCO1/SenC/PrrC family)